jgi:hypothetical protein
MIDLDPALMAEIEAIQKADRIEQAEAERNTWQPVDLDPIIQGKVVEPEPRILPRGDGRPILYRGKHHSLAAEPEAGKSTIAAEAARGEIAAGNRVLVLDFETGPVEIVARLLALGATSADIKARLVYLNPDQALTDEAWHDLQPHLEGVTLAWLDGVTEGMNLQGLSYADNDDIATWQKLLPRRLKRLDIAVLELDHVTKATDSRGRWAIGGQHKLAGVDVGLTLRAVKPFSRGVSGESVLRIEKDRPGHLRAQAAADRKTLARVLFEASPDGSLEVTLQAPDQLTDTFRPTVLMERVSLVVEAHPGATKNTIRQLVNGKNDAKDLALTLLIEEGHVTVEREGQAHRHTSIKPYREANDD